MAQAVNNFTKSKYPFYKSYEKYKEKSKGRKIKIKELVFFLDEKNYLYESSTGKKVFMYKIFNEQEIIKLVNLKYDLILKSVNESKKIEEIPEDNNIYFEEFNIDFMKDCDRKEYKEDFIKWCKLNNKKSTQISFNEFIQENIRKWLNENLSYNKTN